MAGRNRCGPQSCLARKNAFHYTNSLALALSLNYGNGSGPLASVVSGQPLVRRLGMGQFGVDGASMGRLGGLTGVVWALAFGAVPALAAPANTAPAAVSQTLEQIETAANDQDLDAVMAAYDSTFTSDTGFDYGQLRQTLATFWQQYSTLTYDVDLLNWEAAGPGAYTIETRTRVNGVQTLPDRRLNLEADVTSRQRLEHGQIVRQDTLSETSRITSGTNPPTLQTLLPNRLSPGQSFAFDTIVVEPLESRSLMGVAVDEGVTATDFFEPRPVVFDVLSAGGLYKVGTPPARPDQRWISAVIIREDGLVVETRRVSVE